MKLESDHLEFTKYFFKIRQGIEFRVNWHHVYIAEIVEQVIRGEIKNVVINVSPGSSKTEEVVINLIARGLALNVRARFLHISYSDDLAVLNSETAREVVRSDEYQALWPRKIAGDADSKKRWNVEDDGKKAGGVYATSLGGQITGFRAGHMAEGWQGCFPVGTRVWTGRGLIPIDRIVRERMPVKVWAFDYAGNMVLRDVIAWHENPSNEIVRVTFDDGAAVECTPDHRFWTLNRGWVRADSLCIDDRLPRVNSGVQCADGIGSHACVEPQMPARLALQGNDALVFDELDAILSDGRSSLAADPAQVGDTVGAFISGDRSPVLFERVRHDDSTFCLTVDEYHNFTVESGVIVKNCILIDDPLKVEDAYSKTNRDKANRKLSSTVKSRRANPDTPIIVIMQRLAEEDPTGFIKSGGVPGEWTFIEIPALITDEYVAKLPEHIQPLVDSSERDKDGRFSYWPYKEPLQDLLASEKSDRYVFSGQYMQRPSPLGGGIIRSVKFVRYSGLPLLKYRKIYADTAQKTAERNDYSVFECWGHGKDNRIYLIDMIRGKWEAPELKRRAIDFWNKHKAIGAGDPDAPSLRQMLVEDKASGTGLIQEIRSDGGIPIKGIERTKDKLTRVMDVVSQIDVGNVCIPANAGWVSDFVTECESFTADDTHAHDDQVDPMVDAITDMLGGPPPMRISDDALARM